MNEKQTSSEAPSLDGSEPTNAKLAAVMVEQTGKVLRHLARLENLVGDPSPTPVEIANQIDDALREDAELETPKFSDFGRFYLSHLILEIRFPRGTAPTEPDAPESKSEERRPFRVEKCSRCGWTELKEIEFLNSRFLACERCNLLHMTEKQSEVFCEYLKKDSVVLEEFEEIPLRPEAGLETEESAGPAIEYTRVSWEEYGKRIMASLAKSAMKEREMTAMLDAVMEAGLLAATEKGAVALALAKVFAAMIPDGKPMHEIPEGWAPVALAINPATGEFVTLAGPRSEPDGRVEALETMLARQMQASVAGAVGAVREAGRPQPKPRDEARPIAKPRDLARPQPKPGEPDYADYVVAGPLDAGTCESCRNVIGDRVSPNAAGDYLEDLQRDCECENGCRLTVEHEANRWTSALGSRNLEDESEE